MEPTEALAALEVGLRNLILERLGEYWLDVQGAPTRASLEGRRANEQSKRHGAVVSENLLDYTMTPDLGKMIFANWEAFAPVFPDRTRFEVLVNIVEDVRNTVAHSRELLPFERELLSGVAGYVSNSLALHRSSLEGPGSYYPLIESLTDHQGNDLSVAFNGVVGGNRLAVGDTVSIRGNSTPTRGLELVWKLRVGQGYYGMSADSRTHTESRGNSVELLYTVGEEDVSEEFWLEVLLTTESRFHRHTQFVSQPYDDVKAFRYPVKPPYGV